MRIAVLVDHFPSLSETFILRQITGLIKRGHAVDIYANSRGDTARAHPEVSANRLLERTYFPDVPAGKLQRISGVFSALRAHPEIPLKQWLACLNVFEFGRHALSLRLFYSLSRFPGKGAYDIIHCQLEPLGMQGMLFRNLGFLNGRLVTSWRGHDFATFVRGFRQCSYPALYEQGDMFLPVSDSLKTELIADGCSEAKVRVLRSGIDLSQFPFSPRRPQTDGEIRVLSIGRLTENKGIAYGIQAIARLVKTWPRIRYRVIGDGPLMGELRTLVRALELEHCVDFCGWLLQDEVRKELQDATVLITPSYTAADQSKEGIPNVLKEAMATGVPVVGTDHSGIPELISDGKTGYLVPEQNAVALAAAIESLLSQPQRAESMCYAARAHIESVYDIEKLNDELVRIYESLL